LDEFWSKAQSFRPEPELFARFRAYVIDQTQIAGSFYKGPIGGGPCASMVAPAPQNRTTPSLHTALAATNVNE
jgi:hypothetical protein